MKTLEMIRTRVFATTLAALALGTIPTASAAPAKTGYARSGDLDLYYEVHGSGGTPLVVLQGSFCTVEICFGKMLPTLGIKKADVLGYSTGAAVALELAITNPELVNKLVLVSAVYEKAGARKELLELMPTLTVDMMKQTPWYAAYKKDAPQDTFAELVEKVKTIDDSKSWPGGQDSRAEDAGPAGRGGRLPRREGRDGREEELTETQCESDSRSRVRRAVASRSPRRRSRACSRAGIASTP